ncbi:MAG: hypothetical protein JW910_17460 [Anaerolineae bacterium]|nr:hypothetical protein [Anaerolineae bacterium]
MHHSTGEGLIWQGGVREAFTALGYEFWDHGYNGDGLVDPEGNYLGTNWDMPGDNTDPDGWRDIFTQPVTSPPANTFSHMLEYDVIIFKSCFPASDIQSPEQFEDYRRYYLAMRDVMDQHPDKIFVPFTTPPLVPNSTSPDAAIRARQWADYLTSSDYLDGHPNIFVFDFFRLLADDQGYLRAEYRPDEWDSHPNEQANQAVGPMLVEFVDEAVRSYTPGAAPLPPVEQPAPPEEAGAPMAAGDLLLDFENPGDAEYLWSYINQEDTTFVCQIEAPGKDSAYALRVEFNIPVEGSAGCGADLPADDRWSEARGISFYWRADRPDLLLRVGLGVRDPTQTNPDVVEATPFEAQFLTLGEDWSQVVILWSDLVKPEWVGDTGVDVFDPAQVVWIVFDVGQWEQAQAGTIWIDDVQFVVDE